MTTATDSDPGPDFATGTGDTITMNQNVSFPTYYSDRLFDALIAALEIAHEEYGLTNDTPGWDGTYVFHVATNEDESQPNKAGISNTL